MFDELTKYKNNNHFFFTSNEKLENVCNAPKNKSGIYIVYELKNGRIELVYVDYSGKIQNNGRIKHHTGGLFDRIVNGYQFGEIPRKISWKQKLFKEKIEALDIYWYDTVNSETIDIPAFVAATIIQRFFEINGRLPRWNKEL
ncbi:hypothetical protein DRQ07_10690 [candidate division KSB1 bacterium]|nr:MAG: hypothetical protein DRQ07_10690 [candidate division KSB1 bacterium]